MLDAPSLSLFLALPLSPFTPFDTQDPHIHLTRSLPLSLSPSLPRFFHTHSEITHTHTTPYINTSHTLKGRDPITPLLNKWFAETLQAQRGAGGGPSRMHHSPSSAQTPLYPSFVLRFLCPCDCFDLWSGEGVGVYGVYVMHGCMLCTL